MGPTYSRLEPVDELDNVGVPQRLKHAEFVVDHLLVPLDVLLQDDLDSDPARGALGLANDAIGAGTERLAKPILGPIADVPLAIRTGFICRLIGIVVIGISYFFS
jgi:hypothetical protein